MHVCGGANLVVQIVVCVCMFAHVKKALQNGKSRILGRHNLAKCICIELGQA